MFKKIKVLELKGQGLSNRAIARELNCSEGKIRTILKKVSA
ncbi:MAG: LuxR C-terminal-related transcriptional regulator [Clostridium sp.]